MKQWYITVKEGEHYLSFSHEAVFLDTQIVQVAYPMLLTGLDNVGNLSINKKRGTVYVH